MPVLRSILPQAIESPRLRLRPWSVERVDGWADVMAANRTFLSRWMVWALDEPSPPVVARDRFTMFAERFAAGQEWLYAIESRDGASDLGDVPQPKLLGGIGAHPRDGSERTEWSADRGVPETVEVGYWLREEATGRGICTEAVTALIAALRTLGVARIEIRTHPENRPSRAIPRRLGCVLERVIPDAIQMPGGGTGPAEVWVVRGKVAEASSFGKA